LGASASLEELQRKFGFEPDHIAAAAKEQLGGKIAIGPKSNIHAG
jgi:hypothetical protein